MVIPDTLGRRTCTASSVPRPPVVAIAVVIRRRPIAVMYVPAVVDGNTRTPIVVTVIMTAVIRMAPVTRVMHLQVMIWPADRKCGCDAPKITGGKGIAVRIRVVINRVRMRIIVINASWLIDDDFFRLVIRDVDDLIIYRIDLDDAIVIGDSLAFVRFQVTRGISAIAK